MALISAALISAALISACATGVEPSVATVDGELPCAAGEVNAGLPGAGCTDRRAGTAVDGTAAVPFVAVGACATRRYSRVVVLTPPQAEANAILQAMNATTSAYDELRAYCDIAVKHSYDQYEKHGTLHEKAHIAFHDESVWKRKWVPDVFDVTDAASHPVFQTRFSEKQKLAWNHFQWGLDYSSIAQGERQIIVLNGYAVKHFGTVLPSVVELERRESFEETDHISAFTVVLEGIRQRYVGGPKQIWSVPASGFGTNRVNAVVRRAIGELGNFVLGSNFPTLFFLARGMKTHGFKPFENTITTFEDGHPAIRMISHLHRLDESRHMATSLNLARLSSQVLETLPRDNQFLFERAVRACFPHGRSSHYRLDFWKRVLDEAEVYADIPQPEKDALYAHMCERVDANLQTLHTVQTKLTRQANKRIVEECGLSPAMKRIFVDVMRGDPAYASTIDAVVLPEA